MEKPQKKHKLAIFSYDRNFRTVRFNAERQQADELKEYGHLFHADEYYVLTVDARFDFDEVYRYILDLGFRS